MRRVLLLALLADRGRGVWRELTALRPAATATATDTAAPRTDRGTRRTGSGDWTRFGYDAAHSEPRAARAQRGAGGAAARAPRRLPGTVDCSPIYLAGVRVRGRTRNLLVMTTTYGRTVGARRRERRAALALQPVVVRQPWPARRRSPPRRRVADPAALRLRGLAGRPHPQAARGRRQRGAPGAGRRR